MKPLARPRLPLPPRPLRPRQTSSPQAYPARPPLPPDQVTLLRVLSLRGGSATMTELCADGNLSAQTTEHAVDALDALGLVELRQHPLLPHHATVSLTLFGRHTVAEGR